MNEYTLKNILQRTHENHIRKLARFEDEIARHRAGLHEAVMGRAQVNKLISELAVLLSQYPPDPPTEQPAPAPRRWETGVSVTPEDIRSAAGGTLPAWRGALTETMPGTDAVKAPPASAPSQQQIDAADSFYGVLEDPVEQKRTLARAEIQTERARLSREAEQRVAARLADPLPSITGAEAERVSASFEQRVREGEAALDPGHAGVLEAHANAVAEAEKLADPVARAHMLAAIATVKGQFDVTDSFMRAAMRARAPRHAISDAPAGEGAAGAATVHAIDLRPTMRLEPIEPPQRESIVARTVKKWLGRA